MEKSQNSTQAVSEDEQAIKENLDRVLAVGRLLMSVLTEEEKKELQIQLSQSSKNKSSCQ